MKTKNISSLLLAVMVMFMTMTAWCRAEEIRVVKTYYLLKYEYRNFIIPLTNQGVTDNQLSVFFTEVEEELKKIDGLSKDNIEANLAHVLTNIATYRENNTIARAVVESYGSEISEYLETGIVPSSLSEVYDAVIRSIFGENETDKSDLVADYEKYRDIFNSGMSGYTSNSVNKFEQGLRNSLAVLKNSNATQEEIDSVDKELKEAYTNLERIVIQQNGSSSHSDGGSGFSLPTINSDNNANKTKKDFIDVENTYWGYDAISYLCEDGILSGFEDGSFKPNSIITREQFATILCKAFKLPMADQNRYFADVDTNAWYVSYVIDVVESGIMQGVAEDSFGIGSSLIRQDLAVIADRLVQRGMVDHQYNQKESIDFADKDQISDYAVQSVKNMQELGIINGMGDGTFAPQGQVTRAQAAQIIYSLLRD